MEKSTKKKKNVEELHLQSLQTLEFDILITYSTKERNSVFGFIYMFYVIPTTVSTFFLDYELAFVGLRLLFS